MGYLSRRCGLTCDNLSRSRRGDGERRAGHLQRASEPDLFWAMRGGGGNFGVVTSFEYRLHPIAGSTAARPSTRSTAACCAPGATSSSKAPPSSGRCAGLTLAPPLPFLPDEWHGKPVAGGDRVLERRRSRRGRERLARLPKWGKVVGSFVGPMPYPVINQLFNELLPPGLQQYWKGSFAREISDGAIDAHVEHARATPTIQSSTIIYPLDGACQRVAADATAFPYRDATFSTVIAGAWRDRADNERSVRWVRDYYDALRPHSEAGGYVNFMGPEDQDRAPVNYRQNYDRLRRIKSRYDPANLFRVNHNVAPAPRRVDRPSTRSGRARALDARVALVGAVGADGVDRVEAALALLPGVVEVRRDADAEAGPIVDDDVAARAARARRARRRGPSTATVPPRRSGSSAQEQA